ncbi:type I-E CRISPR-associated protein Cse2/CasB [Corynebacterium mastitidis]
MIDLYVTHGQPPRHVTELPDTPGKLTAPTREGLAPITGGQLRAIRASLSLSVADLACWIGVGTATVKRWEAAATTPGWLPTVIAVLMETTDYWVAQMRGETHVEIYHDGWRIVHDRPLPESWWHVVIGRATWGIPGVFVEWADMAYRDQQASLPAAIGLALTSIQSAGQLDEEKATALSRLAVKAGQTPPEAPQMIADTWELLSPRKITAQDAPQAQVEYAACVTMSLACKAIRTSQGKPVHAKGHLLPEAVRTAYSRSQTDSVLSSIFPQWKAAATAGDPVIRARALERVTTRLAQAGITVDYGALAKDLLLLAQGGETAKRVAHTWAAQFTPPSP